VIDCFCTENDLLLLPTAKSLQQQQLEGARESAYLHQVNFYRRPYQQNFYGVMTVLSPETHTSNSKSIVLSILKLLISI